MALRSAEHVLGLPGLVGRNEEKVELGNQLMRFSCRVAETAIHRRIPGGKENPAYSRLWLCRQVQRLLRHEIVSDIFTDFCQWLEPWRKRTRLRTWLLARPELLARRCTGVGICSRTQQPHLVLSRTDASGRFLTSSAEAYPKALCSRLAKCLGEGYESLRTDRRWALCQ